jgi:hypothetical protein
MKGVTWLCLPVEEIVFAIPFLGHNNITDLEAKSSSAQTKSMQAVSDL